MRPYPIVLWIVLMTGPRLPAESVLYVSVSEDQEIASFDIDESCGRVTPSGRLIVEGTPGAMGVSPNGQVLYVSLRSTNSLGSFSIDASTGQLKLLNVISADGNAAYVSTDRTGRYLFTAYYADGKVAVHRLNDDGQIGELVQSVPTAEKAHCILVDRTNRFVFVPHTGPEQVFQFQFDSQTGQLTPHPEGPVQTAEGDGKWGPRHLWFHPTQDFAYLSLEQGSAIAACRVNGETGTLELLRNDSGLPERHSTTPHDFADSNTTADIELTPDGRFAYVSNRGHDSIAGFEVNPQTGLLKSLGQFPTERTPRSFNVHPSGQFLYAAGQSSGNLAAYHITAEGRLEQFQTLPVGNGPAWVQVVTLGSVN